MIEDTLLEAPPDDGTKKYYGVTVGRVINPLDPLAIGRLQVQLPFIDSIDLAPWARVCVPMAGIFSGSYFIPNVGDQVLVAFEHGDVNAPYILGSLWNCIQRPPLPTPLLQTRAIRTLVGNQIVFQEVPPSVTIQNGPTPPVPVPSLPIPTGPYQTIQLDPTGVSVTGLQVDMKCAALVSIMVGGTKITVTPASVDITAAGSLSISAAVISMKSDGAVTITAGGTCSITAPMIKLN